MPLRSSTAEILERGQALYNERQFWEAHDVWEDAWLVEQGDVRRMFQGLIQVTAGCFKAVVRRNPGGAVKLLAAGLEKLEPIPDALGGLALGEFRRAIAETLAEARRWQRGERPARAATEVPRREGG